MPWIPAVARINLSIPDDLTNMVKTNSAMMKGMQSTVDRKLSLMQETLNKQNKGVGKGKNKQQKRQYWSQQGLGNANGNQVTKGGGKSAGPNAGEMRKVKADRGYTKSCGKGRR